MSQTSTPGPSKETSKTVDIFNLMPQKNSVLINDFQLKPNLILQLKKMNNNPSFWHKFVVFNCEKYERNFILKTLVDYLHPLDFLPVYFTKFQGKAYFLARNCLQAVIKICEECQLSLPNPDQPETPFKLNIVLNIANTETVKIINAEENIRNVLLSRKTGKKLCLDKFCEDPGLQEFCPLSQPKIMLYVLSLAEKLQPKTISLRNNDIRTLNPIKSLNYFKSNLRILDLSNNKINSAEDLEPLKHLTHLNSVVLSYNPFCANFDDPMEYFQQIREFCPNIERLDAEKVYLHGLCIRRKTFLCSNEGADLVNQFIEYFFTVYDEDRQSIGSLYDKQAIFSLTYTLIKHLDLNSTMKETEHFKCTNRNFLQHKRTSKKVLLLYRGIEEIHTIFSKLAPTDHDPVLFFSDLMYYTGSTAVITITGRFKEGVRNFLETEKTYGFTRTFVLKCSKNEWCIVNDQLHVYHPIFETALMTKRDIHKTRNFIPNSQKDFAVLEKTLQLITHLTPEYSKKFLNEAKYDLKNTLELFLKMYMNDEISEKGFNEESILESIRESTKQLELLKDIAKPDRNQDNWKNLPEKTSSEISNLWGLLTQTVPESSNNQITTKPNISKPLSDSNTSDYTKFCIKLKEKSTLLSKTSNKPSTESVKVEKGQAEFSCFKSKDAPSNTSFDPVKANIPAVVTGSETRVTHPNTPSTDSPGALISPHPGFGVLETLPGHSSMILPQPSMILPQPSGTLPIQPSMFGVPQVQVPFSVHNAFINVGNPSLLGMQYLPTPMPSYPMEFVNQAGLVGQMPQHGIPTQINFPFEFANQLQLEQPQFVQPMLPHQRLIFSEAVNPPVEQMESTKTGSSVTKSNPQPIVGVDSLSTSQIPKKMSKQRYYTKNQKKKNKLKLNLKK